MIKINLLRNYGAVSSTAGKETSDNPELDIDEQKLKRDLMVRFLVVLIFPVILYLIQEQNLPAKKALLAEKNKKYNELVTFNQQKSTKEKENKTMKDEITSLQNKINRLEVISKFKTREIRMLDVIQQSVTEKIWLTDLDYNPPRLMIMGIAPQAVDHQNFSDSLSKSPIFREVSFQGSTKAETTTGSVLKFEIAASLERNE